MTKLLIFTAAVLAATATTAQAEECLQYDKPVTLSGTINLRAAGYSQEIPTYERGHLYPVLTLDAPICAAGPDDDTTERGVKELQIADCPRYWPRGARVLIDGELFPRQTWHHRTPVLILPKQVKRVNGQTLKCSESL